MNNKICSKLIVFSLSLAISCTLWNARDWEKLQNRNFYFQKFLLIDKGGSKKKALSFMKDFPIEKTLTLLSKKYNINIDLSEFKKFTVYGDSDEISSFTPILNEFTWESAIEKQNTIEIEYNTGDMDEVIREYNYNSRKGPSYRIQIKTDGKLRDLYLGEVTDVNGVVTDLYSKIKEKEFAGQGSLVLTRPEARNETVEGRIKDEIKKYGDSLVLEEKEKFKETMIEFINNI